MSEPGSSPARSSVNTPEATEVHDASNDTPDAGQHSVRVPMSLSHARDEIDALLDYEAQTGRLDKEQIEALEVASTVLSDVLHADVAKYLD